MSTGPGWRRAIPARLAYFDFLQISPLTSSGKVSVARAELVEAITARTGRRTVAKPGRARKEARRVACRALNRRCRRVSSRKTDCNCPRRLGTAETRGVFVIRVHSQLPQIRGNGILYIQLTQLGAEKKKERT